MVFAIKVSNTYCQKQSAAPGLISMWEDRLSKKLISI